MPNTLPGLSIKQGEESPVNLSEKNAKLSENIVGKNNSFPKLMSSLDSIPEDWSVHSDSEEECASESEFGDIDSLMDGKFQELNEEIESLTTGYQETIQLLQKELVATQAKLSSAHEKLKHYQSSATSLTGHNKNSENESSHHQKEDSILENKCGTLQAESEMENKNTNLTLPLSNEKSVMNDKDGGDMRNNEAKTSVSHQGKSGSTDSGIGASNFNLEFPTDSSSVFQFGDNNGYFINSRHSSCPASPTIATANSTRARYPSAGNHSIPPIISTGRYDADGYQRNSVIVNTTLEELSAEEQQKISGLLSNADFRNQFKASLKKYILDKNIDLINSTLGKIEGIEEKNIADIVDLVKEELNKSIAQLVTQLLSSGTELNSALSTLSSSLLSSSSNEEIVDALRKILIDNNNLDDVLKASVVFSQKLLTRYTNQIPLHVQNKLKPYAISQAQNYFNASLTGDFLTNFLHKIQPCLQKLSVDSLAGAGYFINPQYHKPQQPVQIDLTLTSTEKKIIEDTSKEILDVFCIEYFSPMGQNDITPNYIINGLESKFTEYGLAVSGCESPIEKIADKIVSEVLDEANVARAITTAIEDNNPADQRNLIERIDAQLKAQVDQRTETETSNYSSKGRLAAILNKIILTEDSLPDTELQTLLLPNPALQYADNERDFSFALLDVYPTADYPSVHYPANFTISDERFRQARQLLRAEALDQIKKQYHHPESREDTVDAEDIDTLTTRPWLEKKCQLITGKPFNLELHEEEKERFNRREYQQLILLSDLNLAAITHASIDQLKKELEKLSDLDSKLIVQRHQHLSSIEEILLDYPQLSELMTFEESLNDTLTKLSFSDENQTVFQVNTEQAKALLQGINQHIENNINNAWRLFKLNLNVNPPVATTGVNTLLQGVIENGKNTWNSIFLTPFAEKIYADISATFTSDNNSLSESKAKELIVTAINLLRSNHGLKEKFQKREEWNNNIKQRYAMLEVIQTYRSDITHRMAILKEGIKTKKTESIKSIASSLLSSVFVPSTYCIIASPEEFHLGPTDTLFNRREPLKLGQKINYEQELGNKNIATWSVTRNGENSLAYHTKTAWYEQLGEKNRKELTFSQMIDALNSFKNSEIIYFRFSRHCPKAAEKQYRLFISVYNGLRQESGKEGPLLCCSPNKKLNINESELREAKAEIKQKLNLYADERKAVDKNLPAFCSRGRG